MCAFFVCVKMKMKTMITVTDVKPRRLSYGSMEYTASDDVSEPLKVHLMKEVC